MTLATILLVLMLLAVLAALLAGVPVILAIGGVPLLFALAGALTGGLDPALLMALPSRIYGIMANSLLMSVPFFVLMGVVLDRSGIAGAMLAAMTRLARGSPVRLSLAVLAVSTLIAASTGIVGATIVMLATIALPGLLRAGVPPTSASGLVCASGTLGQIIPPSIMLILLADQVSNAWIEGQRAAGNFAAEPVTVSDLFAAAILPGFLLAALYGLWIVLTLRGKRSAVPDVKPVDGTAAGNAAAAVLPPVLLIVFVLGSILAGIAAPTEAASLGAAGAILLALLRRESGRMAALGAAVMDTVRLTGVIFGIVIAASVLSLVFRGFTGDELVEDWLTGLPGAGGNALIAVMAAIFLLGFVLEFVEIIYIVIPVAAPILFAAGIDPLWFAILVAMNLQTSFLTPPFGLALFYFRSAAPAEITTAILYRAIIPFVGIQLVALALVWAFPAIAIWLPQALFR